MIEGLSHLTFIVSDLDVTERLLVHVLDAERVYDSGDQPFSLSPERFYTIGGLWIATMQGDPLPSRTYNHIAFKINDADFEMYQARLHHLGLEIKQSRPRIEGEGRSLYFYDTDNHLFELHTGTLQQRLHAYNALAGITT